MTNDSLQEPPSSTALPSCRLCDSHLKKSFSSRILGKYDINYHICTGCNSLQTDYPYWLDEAYSEPLFSLDTGAVQRNLNNFAACYLLGKILPINSILDFGARDGLLCRFLRDHLFDCYAHDKYSKPSYSIDFQIMPRERDIDLVVAFEVLEHFSNPKTDLEEIFMFQPKYVLATTELYSNQGKEWSYLAQESGQHIFFYSGHAVNLIAQMFGYGVTIVGNMILFYKTDIPGIQAKIISCQATLSGWIFQAIKSYIFLLPTPGVSVDAEFVKRRAAQLLTGA